MKPKIKNKKPWFWFIVQMFYKNVEWKNVAFTFGNTIYAPKVLTEAEMAHEMVHVKHQRGSKLFGLFCLIRYRYSRSYRLKCEMEAYKEQAKYVDKLGRSQIAQHLSSPIYGRMISYREAFKFICE